MLVDSSAPAVGSLEMRFDAPGMGKPEASEDAAEAGRNEEGTGIARDGVDDPDVVGRRVLGAGIPRDAGRVGPGEVGPDDGPGISLESRFVPIDFGRGEAERGEVGPESVAEARAIAEGAPAFEAASVARRFASISLDEVGMDSITAVRFLDSPCN